MYKIEKKFLTKNPYSRPGIRLKSVNGIVVHWVANTNTSAIANRNFFEMRKDETRGYGSAHFIIDLDGNIIQCLPLYEMAYHVGANEYNPNIIKNLGIYPNNCTLGIECTHINNYGKMTIETYYSLIKLTHDLLKKYNLNNEKDLYRHYDITNKNCHKWFVDNPDKWEEFKKKVGKYGE